VPGKDVTLDIIAMELTPELLASNLPEGASGTRHRSSR